MILAVTRSIPQVVRNRRNMGFNSEVVYQNTYSRHRFDCNDELHKFLSDLLPVDEHRRFCQNRTATHFVGGGGGSITITQVTW
jgi:hypothetical protein